MRPDFESIPSQLHYTTFLSPGGAMCKEVSARRSSVKDPGHAAKSAGSRLQLNTHTPYVCVFAWSDIEHGCVVYTELAPRRQQFHVAPAMPALKQTTSVDIQKRASYKKAGHSCELSESAQESGE